jgi:hypothetical protein
MTSTQQQQQNQTQDVGTASEKENPTTDNKPIVRNEI